MVRKWILFLAVCSFSAQAAGTRPRLDWTLAHFQHTAFTKKDGAPLPNHLIETRDGYLWGDHNKGLVRFDGSKFQPFVPRAGESFPGKQIDKMFAPPSGGLWVAFDEEGVSFILHDHITSYGKKDGFGDRAADFYEDRRGGLIAYAYPGLLKYGEGHWTALVDEGSPLQIRATTQDQDFNIWAVTRAGHLMVLREGAKEFVDAGIEVPGALHVFAGPGHSIFVSGRGNVTRRYVDRGGKLIEIGPALPYSAIAMVVDRRGGLWISTATSGIHYFKDFNGIVSEAKVLPSDERMNREDGLTGNFAYVFEDSKGTIWVGTDGGVDRFVPSSFSQISLPPGINMVSITPGEGDDVWIGSEHSPVLHLALDHLTETVVPATALTMHTTVDRAVFAATADQLWQLSPDTPHPIADLPAKGIGGVRAIARTANGDILLSSRRKNVGLVHLDGTEWRPVPNMTGAPTALLAEPSGTVWAGEKDRLTCVRQGNVQAYSIKEGLATGTIKVMVAHNGVLWIGGDQAVQTFDGHTFRTIKLAGAKELADISGLLFDQAENLWIQTLEGIVRVGRHDVTRALADHTYAPLYQLFDSSDGVPGAPAQTFTLPTMRLGGDGRLWITGQTSAAWLDPNEIEPRQPLNRPVIENISGGDTQYDPSKQDSLLPKDARDLQFSFTTPELRYPERVRFQYRLRGFDDHWQDAGNARQASYHHLPGGAYIFEVRSANLGEPWEQVPASVSFGIGLRYYETWWFKLLMIGVASAAVWALVLFQMRVATRRERSRMQIRLDEREAVARDLHDTLLQSNLAVVLQLKALASGTSDPELKNRLEALTALSRDANVEARDKVQALRTAGGETADCITEINALGRRLSLEYDVRFDIALEGHKRPLKAQPCAELVPLISEVMLNAFRHANATAITATFSYGWLWFDVTIADNGVGLDKSLLVQGAPKGHWGLKGVRERATRLKARLIYKDGPAAGTVVQVRIRSWTMYE